MEYDKTTDLRGFAGRLVGKLKASFTENGDDFKSSLQWLKTKEATTWIHHSQEQRLKSFPDSLKHDLKDIWKEVVDQTKTAVKDYIKDKAEALTQNRQQERSFAPAPKGMKP